MPHDLSALHRVPRRDPGVARPELSALALAQRLGWPRLPDLGEIHEALAEIEAAVRSARRNIGESIDLGESDRVALRRVLPDLERHARLVPAGIALIRALSR